MEEKKKKLEDIERIKKEEADEAERMKILMAANEIKEETFSFDFDNQLVLKSEIADMMLEEIDDPETKYTLYYNVVNRLLKKYLPKGEKFKPARDYIYEEKNIFLTRGHKKDERGIRGADGRMAYIPDVNELINVITEWIATKGGMYDLYTKIRALNVERGYHKE